MRQVPWRGDTEACALRHNTMRKHNNEREGRKSVRTKRLVRPLRRACLYSMESGTESRAELPTGPGRLADGVTAGSVPSATAAASHFLGTSTTVAVAIWIVSFTWVLFVR